MNQVIIYLQDNGVPAVIIPTAEFLQTHSIEEVALKDVPKGKPFKIIPMADLPNSLQFPQEVWEVNESDLTDGIGGQGENV